MRFFLYLYPPGRPPRPHCVLSRRRCALRVGSPHASHWPRVGLEYPWSYNRADDVRTHSYGQGQWYVRAVPFTAGLELDLATTMSLLVQRSLELQTATLLRATRSRSQCHSPSRPRGSRVGLERAFSPSTRGPEKPHALRFFDTGGFGVPRQAYRAKGPSAVDTAAGMALSTLLLRLQRAGTGPFSSHRTGRSREEARPRSPQHNDKRSREGSPRRPRRGDLATSSSPRWSRGHVGRHARGRMEEGSPVGHAAVPSRLGGRGTPKGRCAVSTACHGWRVPRLTVAHANRLADTSASASGQHNNVSGRPMKGHHGPWLGTAKSSRPSSGVWVVEASTVQYRVYTLAR